MFGFPIVWDHVVSPAQPHYDIGAGPAQWWDFSVGGWHDAPVAGPTIPGMPDHDGFLRLPWSVAMTASEAKFCLEQLLSQPLSSSSSSGHVVAWTEASEAGRYHIAVARYEVGSGSGSQPGWL